MSVSTKIREVMRQVPSLGKDRQLEAGARYEYLSEEKVTGELNRVFAEVGLTVWPSAMELLETREDETSGGKVLHVARIRVTYQFTDPDDGDSVFVQALGEGSDMGDKVLNKCMTAALKYALRQACMISTADDPDHTASRPSRSARKQAETVPSCHDCQKPIGPLTQGGQVMRSAKEVVELSMEKEGMALCSRCYADRQHVKKQLPAADPAEAERLGLVAKASQLLDEVNPALRKGLIGEQPLAERSIDGLHAALEILQKHAAGRAKA